MNNVKNPIIIDQNYCDQADGPCKAEVIENEFNLYILTIRKNNLLC